ncbi:acetyltransferase [Oceanobacillus rekensis]|uniref:acetyltransferase n=1 Tax=Oceanobacillus rekensis TaxID=937927 RepID=UPI000B454973|nr:acetyltransferase [Oceanobacillus rekensis]
MNDIVIYGAGGFAREVALLIEQINAEKPTWNLLGFIDDNVENTGKILNGYSVLGDSKWIEDFDKELSVSLGIGSPRAKEKIINKIKHIDSIGFPNIIHPTVGISNTNILGEGIIICEGNILTCNISLNNFVTINLNCTIGHDTIIDEFCTLLPNASISGGVNLNKRVDFGTNATIIQGINVGENTIVGAGAVVVKDLPANCTAVGMPAKPIKFHEN